MRTKKTTPAPVPMARVIRNSRDGSTDYFIPASEAKALYAAGKLQWDLTNNAYCTLTNNGSKH